MEFIKNDIYELEEIESFYNRFSDRTKEYFSQVMMKKMNDLMNLINECQSPIEELMAIALDEQSRVWDLRTEDYILQPQERIEIGNVKYIVDFFIGILINDKWTAYVIECDGHDFHEKTKEQVRKDKKRERDLMANGYRVIRFSGSEIHENPSVCAREVTKIIFNNQSKD